MDFDDSNSNTYGAQQLTLFDDYYHEYCYMTLFVFEGNSGKLVLPILRPGRPNKRANVTGLMIRLIEKLRQKWKNTFIVIRYPDPRAEGSAESTARAAEGGISRGDGSWT